MLIHFVLTVGKHPYGTTVSEIIKHLERGLPHLLTNDVDLHDLISWMLLYEPNERPTINQVVAYAFSISLHSDFNDLLFLGTFSFGTWNGNGTSF